MPPFGEYTNRVVDTCFTRTVSVGPGETGVSLVLFTHIVRKTREQNSAFDPFASIKSHRGSSTTITTDGRVTRFTVDGRLTVVTIRARPAAARMQFDTAVVSRPCTELGRREEKRNEHVRMRFSFDSPWEKNRFSRPPFAFDSGNSSQ